MSNTTELSNLSYTNKDFNSIYAELLEYTKQLSYRWDPTASDESDPGVVLLKLAALIGDKDNYNIDKNVLELMPASVTQLAAARQLFDQCGYAMRYYQSATGDLNLTIKQDLLQDSEEELDSKTTYTYKIPKFTMFTDQDASVVYTSTQDISVAAKTAVPIPVIEGTIVKYTVNNDPLITPLNLDSKNRLYFTESNIAENGIFIVNANPDKISTTIDRNAEWLKVDNLQTQPKSTPCFKFGVTLDNTVCYIEFPDDIEMLMGEGIYINYILTTGAQGNIGANKLKQFYTDTKFERSDKVEVDATIENISLRNILPISGGADPESIDSAYKNYQRVRDTFDTLVSLKDYTDYIVTSKSASNGYVCDRTNDIQHSYKIVTSDGDTVYQKTKVETTNTIDGEPRYRKVVVDGIESYKEIEEPTMDAFDLCVYALKYVPTVTTDTAFKESFTIVDMNKDSSFAEKLAQDTSIKSLQHDYLFFEKERILMLKNKYPIIANIVPRYPLTTSEKLQVVANVEAALCNALNSKEIKFGESISAELIQNTIIEADERIKTLIDFVSPKYETYAVYLDTENKFQEMRIDADSDDAGYVEVHLNVSTFNEYKSDPAKKLYVREINEIKEVVSSDSFDGSKTYYEKNNELTKLWNKFRAEIFAKNILAGITPLYDDKNTFTFSTNQKNVKIYSPVVEISTNTVISCTDENKQGVYVSPEIRENESILLTAPNFVEENNFSSYVKVLYYLPNAEKDILPDSQYELRSNDYIIFFWKDSDATEDYTYIKYDSSDDSPARFFTPVGFKLLKQQDLTSTAHSTVHSENVYTWFSNLDPGKGTTSSYDSRDNVSEDNKAYSQTEFVKTFLKSDTKNQVLTGVKSIKTTNINKIAVNNNDNGCSYVYWFLNSKIDGEYTLFKKDKDSTYTLKAGEYFVYTNDAKNVLHILGQGTKLDRTVTDTDWIVNAIDYPDLLAKGIDALEGLWYTLRKVDVNNSQELPILYATEQQQILIGPGNEFEITRTGNNTQVKSIDLNSKDPVQFYGDDATYSLKYKDSKGNVNIVPEIATTSVGWSATTLLNLNMSSTLPQVLWESQSLKILQQGNEEPEELKGETGNDGRYVPVFVQCTEELNMLGSQEIDLTTMFPKKVVSLLSYNHDKTSVEDGMTSLANSTTDVIVVAEKNATQIEANLDCELLVGKYLIHLKPSYNVDDLDIQPNEPDGVSIKELAPYTYTIEVTKEFNEPKSLFKITRTSSSALEQDLILTIPPLFKYDTDILDKIQFDYSVYDNDEFTTEQLPQTFERFLHITLRELDPHSEYSYTHRPKNPILNPLNSIEFMRKRHFYNPYTICEWDAIITENNVDKITIHDVVR